MSEVGRLVYRFPGDLNVEVDPALLGGKGAALAWMGRLGLPVPEGFTITTEAYVRYMKAGELPDDLMNEVLEQLSELEKRTGRRLGDDEDPLLVSVRSGAPVSMPGMMDTVLNLGLNDRSVAGMARTTGDERFAYDSYRRFIQMFGNIVIKVPADRFEGALTGLKEERGAKEDTDLFADDLKELVKRFKWIVAEGSARAFPENPKEQLRLAIEAVFDSWRNERAIAYRKEYGIPEDLGTAVNVQRMVFGNADETSATGVAFTRNPTTGERGVFGEFLPNAQGEDVVAGIRTPRPLSEMEEMLPRAYGELLETARKLEREYRDMQDVEFTVERDKLFLLQTRCGKRTVAAALKVAWDMAEEGLISREEALLRIEPDLLAQLLHPRVDPSARLEVLAKGLGASPGTATGKVVLTAEEAEERGKAGEAVILVRRETNPDDIAGVIAAKGVLTALGGMTSHAAVVARGMGKPSVTGCEGLQIDSERGVLRLGERKIKIGDTLTIDGSAGEVIAGEVPLVAPEINEDLEQVLRWADEVRTLGIRANADTPTDAERARQFGAEGIGLCRTEHMFMQEGRLEIMRRMILSQGEEALEEALQELEPFQQGDFEGIFEAMSGLPVTVRLLDPPLHEFLPNSKSLRTTLAELEAENEKRNRTGKEVEELRRILEVVEDLEEANPMLGLRGVRLGILRPQIYRMQARAIARAARATRVAGHEPVVEVMIPLVGFPSELERMRDLVKAELGEESALIGTMIELPRACAVADEIARDADFFSFGTNDLTQTVCGVSRDDAEGKFLSAYLDGGILDANPFEQLDQQGVGKLVAMACELGRATDPDLKLGVCGEHGGDPKSIGFFHGVGLDYVSCSSYRVPAARLAAAQAALRCPLRS
jgi:pyruvate,orthophosphate dikinase